MEWIVWSVSLGMNQTYFTLDIFYDTLTIFKLWSLHFCFSMSFNISTLLFYIDSKNWGYIFSPNLNNTAFSKMIESICTKHNFVIFNILNNRLSGAQNQDGCSEIT